MNDWNPQFNQDMIGATSVKLINEWLSISYPNFIQKVEGMLAFGSLGEVLIRSLPKQVKAKNGDNLSEFSSINPQLKTGSWRTDWYLQDAFRVICNDTGVQTYLMQLSQYPLVEQITRIGEFLHEHPSVKKSHFGRKRVALPMATLIYRMGLDNVLGCNDRK